MSDERLMETRLGEHYAEHLAILDQRLRSALEGSGLDGLIVLAGNEQLIARDDLTYPFTADPYFKAWVPLTEHPGCALKLVPGERPLLVFLRPEDYWHKPPEDPKGYWVAHFDIDIVKTSAEATRALEATSGRYAAIGTDDGGLVSSAANDPMLLKRLDFLRAYKTPYEITCIEHANRIAARGHAAAKAGAEQGASEFQLNQIYCEATAQREVKLPYPNIIALNEHASVLHYQGLVREVPDQIRSLLIDAGAEFNGYASDVTRTWSFGDPDFQSLINAVDEMQQSLCAEATAGADFVELNALAHREVATILAEHRLVTCSPEQAYETGITRTFLPHGLGHLIGLQVHDVGGRQTTPDGALRQAPAEHPHLRLTRVLEPGMVITMEPGIYFIPMLLRRLGAQSMGKSVNWKDVEAFVPFGGVRIEDDIVVNESEAHNLTRSFLSVV